MSSASQPVTAPAPQRLPKSRFEMVEVTARLCQRLGMPRSTGQIYGLLFLSVEPLSLDEIAEALGLSKASASTGTRHLIGWHAIRQVWKPGDRKDFYEVQADLGDVLRANYYGFFKPKLEAANRKLAVLQELLDADLQSGAIQSEEHAVCHQRLESIARMHSRIQKVLPFAEKLL
jgi:DNA-binding transcriptional regulator GbsR (MarR family)